VQPPSSLTRDAPGGSLAFTPAAGRPPNGDSDCIGVKPFFVRRTDSNITTAYPSRRIFSAGAWRVTPITTLPETLPGASLVSAAEVSPKRRYGLYCSKSRLTLPGWYPQQRPGVQPPVNMLSDTFRSVIGVTAAHPISPAETGGAIASTLTLRRSQGPRSACPCRWAYPQMAIGTVPG